MNEILKKRIEEACISGSKQYSDTSKYSKVGYLRGFNEGSKYALSNQWISVEESLPEYEEDVLIAYGDDEYGLCHRSNSPDVLTDINGFCNYAYKEVLAWLPIPKFETNKTE